jgi:hypothetical protein
MAAPSNISYRIQNGNDAVLTWTSVTYANSYNIYELMGHQKNLINTVTSASTTLSNLPAGEHTYVIHSLSSRFGESSEGIEISFTIDVQNMQAPANLTYTLNNGKNVTLKWNSATYATSYKIYQLVNGEKVLISTVNTTNITFNDLSNGSYEYVIHSYSDRFGESDKGSQITVNIGEVTMAPPSNFTYSINNGNDIVLSWDKAQNVTNYKVYQIINNQKILKSTLTGTTVTYANMPEGSYTYEVISNSTIYGESEGSQLTIQLTLPVMQAPANLIQTLKGPSEFNLSWEASSFANSYKVYQIVDGKKVLRSTVSTTTVSYTNMAPGEYSFIVHSYSSRFGESPEGSSLTFSLNGQTMEAPTNLTYTLANENDITLKWTAAPYSTNYIIYRVIGEEKTLEKTTTSTSITFSNMPADDYHFIVTSVSTLFGESSSGAEVKFTLVLPTMTAPNNLKYTIQNVNTCVLTWDQVSYANSYKVYELINEEKVLKATVSTLTAKITNISVGNHTYIVHSVSNRFGESEFSNKITENIIYPDMGAPTVSAKIVGTNGVQLIWNFITYANGYNVYEIVDENPILLVKNLNNLTYQVNNLSYEDHQFYVTSFSNSFGESSPSNTVIVKLDNEAPVTTCDAPTDWVCETPVVVNLHATDNKIGVSNTYYSINDSDFYEGTSFTVDNEGIYKISYCSVDKLGNKEDVKTSYLKIDSTAPVTTVVSPVDTEKFYTDNVSVILSATDKLSSVANTLYSIDGSDFIKGTSFTVTGEGAHKISFYSVDNAGNKEAVKYIELNIGMSTPEISMDLNPLYKLCSIIKLKYTVDSTSSKIVSQKMTVKVPNCKNEIVVANNSYFILARPGTYTVTITLKNAAGVTTTIQKQFVVYIPVAIDVTPKIINNNNGIITARICLPNTIFLRNFDLNTATLNGVKALTSNNGYYNQAKLGQFNFRRSDFNWNQPKTLVELRCYVDGYLLIGQTIVNVQNKQSNNLPDLFDFGNYWNFLDFVGLYNFCDFRDFELCDFNNLWDLDNWKKDTYNLKGFKLNNWGFDDWTCSESDYNKKYQNSNNGCK